jgi:hypothetical protein
LRLRQDRRADASDAFERALERLPAHAPALAALSVVADAPKRRSMRVRLERRLAALDGYGARVEAATARAVSDVLANRPAEAARGMLAALEAAPAGSSAGWTVPVEPLLDVAASPAGWAAVLAVLRDRAA